jgi:hypothetical protein
LYSGGASKNMERIGIQRNTLDSAGSLGTQIGGAEKRQDDNIGRGDGDFTYSYSSLSSAPRLAVNDRALVLPPSLGLPARASPRRGTEVRVDGLSRLQWERERAPFTFCQCVVRWLVLLLSPEGKAITTTILDRSAPRNAGSTDAAAG